MWCILHVNIVNTNFFTLKPDSGYDAAEFVLTTEMQPSEQRNGTAVEQLANTTQHHVWSGGAAIVSLYTVTYSSKPMSSWHSGQTNDPTSGI